MSAARHLPLAIACAALVMALNERGHRLAREAEKRRFVGLMRRMGENAARRLEASPLDGGRPLDEHERMVLTMKRGNDRVVMQRARAGAVERRSGLVSGRGTHRIAALALGLAAGHVAAAWYWPHIKRQRSRRLAIAIFWKMHGLDETTAPAAAKRIGEPLIARLPRDPLVVRALLAARKTARSWLTAFSRLRAS